MNYTIQENGEGVVWEQVSELLKTAGLGSHAPETHEEAFNASHTTIFIYEADKLIGVGRALSDGQYQAAVYDCAVHPDYQGRGLGSKILDLIAARLSHCNIILYTSPGKEGFYLKHGFRMMKTGMALFIDVKSKEKRGFIE